MGFVLQFFGSLMIVICLLTFSTAVGAIHQIFGAILGVGGFLMWGQSYLIHYAKKQSEAQEKLLLIWKDFEKSRKGAL